MKLFLPKVPLDGRPLDPSVVRQAQMRRMARATEPDSRFAPLLPDVQDVTVDLIKPRIHFCASGEDFRIYNHCRQLQTIPNASRIGRQIRALVLDDGQPTGPTLMGVFGLASPTYALASRDAFLNWSGTSERSKKNKGLRRLMDLAVCLSVPPYSSIFGGKLLASLALTEDVAAAFQRKYSEPLLALTTTCATGMHCPIFHRIMLRRGGLYRRVGETAGWTLSWVSSETLQLARELHLGTSDSRDFLSFSSKPLVVMRGALSWIGVPYKQLLRLGRPKAVYVGTASQENVAALRSGDLSYRSREGISMTEVVGFWKTRLLPKRVGSSYRTGVKGVMQGRRPEAS